MKLKLLLTLSFVSLLTSCTIYRSPQRKEFESESPQFRVQNLKAEDCSHQSFRSKAHAKRLVTVVQNTAYSSHLAQTSSDFLWEYLVGDESVFETDNLNGVYCVYANN